MHRQGYRGEALEPKESAALFLENADSRAFNKFCRLDRNAFLLLLKDFIIFWKKRLIVRSQSRVGDVQRSLPRLSMRRVSPDIGLLLSLRKNST